MELNSDRKRRMGDFGTFVLCSTVVPSSSNFHNLTNSYYIISLLFVYAVEPLYINLLSGEVIEKNKQKFDRLAKKLPPQLEII